MLTETIRGKNDLKMIPHDMFDGNPTVQLPVPLLWQHRPYSPQTTPMRAGSVEMGIILYGSSPTAALNPFPENPSTPPPKPEHAHNAAQFPGVKQVPSCSESRLGSPPVLTEA